MEQLNAEGATLIQQRNEMELKMQASDHERDQLEKELSAMTQVTDAEQQKHKAQLEHQSSAN